jgi:hypothetical protein
MNQQRHAGLEVSLSFQNGPGRILGVERIFLVASRPFSMMTKSVKVPPVSTPMRTIFPGTSSPGGPGRVEFAGSVSHRSMAGAAGAALA